MTRLIKNLEYLIESRNETVKGASRNAGLGETTIRDIMSEPGKSSRIDTLRKLADYFDVSTDALMGIDLSRVSAETGTTEQNTMLREETLPFDMSSKSAQTRKVRLSKINSTGQNISERSSETIRELDISAQGGFGVNVEQENIVREWGIPADYLRVFTRTHTDNLFIIGVVGDSMAPDFPPGQRVLVDVSDKLPSPEGVFVVFDGFGLMIKRCQMVPHSNPAMVRLISTNKEYPINELELTDDMIKGRVIGSWKWS